MNNARRKQIQEIAGKLSDLIPLKDDLESIKDEEQEYYDNMPEGIQSGEKGEKAREAIEALESLINALDEVESYKDDLENTL